jgi:prepilin-type N-terminal cleavage/methylation domain-containing protein
MMKSNRKFKRSAEVDDSGFTLIELLIVIVVLGILAAIVVFALSGVTGQSVTAACQSDAKTVGIAVGALEAENPTAYQAYKTTDWDGATGVLVSSSALAGSPFLQSWPTGNMASYTITVAGTDSTAKTSDAPAVTPSLGDVLVTGTKTGLTYDATVNPVSACSIAHLS